MNPYVIGGLIAALAGLLGGWLVHEREKAKKTSEEDRWYGQLFLQRKFDALSRLHEALVNCRFALGGTELAAKAPNLDSHDSVEKYERNLRTRSLELVRARVIASIYLSKDEDDQIGLAVTAFVQVTNEIRARIGEFNRELSEGKGGMLQWMTIEEWEIFFAGYRPASDCLKRLLTPKLPRGSDTKANT